MKRSTIRMLGAGVFCFMMAASAGAADHGTITTQNLVWLKDGGCLGGATWNGMQNRIKALGHGRCDLTDNSTPGQWRMPTVEEICDHISALKMHLLDRKAYYWTATEAWNDPSRVYIIEFNSCRVHSAAKDLQYSRGLAVRRKVHPLYP